MFDVGSRVQTYFMSERLTEQINKFIDVHNLTVIDQIGDWNSWSVLSTMSALPSNQVGVLSLVDILTFTLQHDSCPKNPRKGIASTRSPVTRVVQELVKWECRVKYTCSMN